MLVFRWNGNVTNDAFSAGEGAGPADAAGGAAGDVPPADRLGPQYRDPGGGQDRPGGVPAVPAGAQGGSGAAEAGPAGRQGG